MRDPARVRVTGPLEGHAPGFIAQLAGAGYARDSAVFQLRLMAHVSRWLAEEGLDSEGFTSAQVERFLAARRAAGYRTFLSRRGVAPLLAHLRALGVVPIEREPAGSEVEALLERYRVYLLGERGLTVGTVGGYVDGARPFLEGRLDHRGQLDLEALTPAEVLGFVLAECRQRPRRSAKRIVGSLRSLLRFLHVEGVIARPLAPVVPSVAGWRLQGLPRGLAPEQVRLLLCSCDRSTVVGRRDFAIVTMLVRLGLRRAEVAALQLDDIDWRAGELVVRGKGGRIERLPLPVDVGEAIVAYLRDGRPASTVDRAVFVCPKAPPTCRQLSWPMQR
jgi:integrase/recombinase XerD